MLTLSSSDVDPTGHRSTPRRAASRGGGAFRFAALRAPKTRYHARVTKPGINAKAARIALVSIIGP